MWLLHIAAGTTQRKETMKTKQYISIAFTLTLLLLWIPVAIEKLFDFDTFKYASS